MESTDGNDEASAVKDRRVQGSSQVKLKQYKNFGYVAGVIAISFAIMMAFSESRNSDNLKASRYYKKEIKTGVDGLSDQELWVEKSTNEIELTPPHFIAMLGKFYLLC